MTKRFPRILNEHILSINWDVRKVWALESPVKLVERLEYDYLLDLPLWSSVQGKGMLFDISPMTVIKNPMASVYQTERLKSTITKYPLDFLMYCGRPWILDGVHRLAKLYMTGEKFAKIRIHNLKDLSVIAPEPQCWQHL